MGQAPLLLGFQALGTGMDCPRLTTLASLTTQPVLSENVQVHYERKPSYAAAPNMVNCLRRALLLRMPTSPVNPTRPLSLGMSCPAWSLSTSTLSSEFLSRVGEKAMCCGLVLGLLAQAGLCPHCQKAVQGDVLLWKRGQGQRQKMQKTAENVTPGYHGCNPPKTSLAAAEREAVQGSHGSAMGISWSSNIWGGSRCCKGHLQAGTGYNSACSHRCFGPSHAWIWMPSPSKAWVPLEQRPPHCILHPSFWASHQKWTQWKALLKVLWGFRTPALTLFAHLLLVKNEIIPFSCQRLKIKMSQMWFCITAVRLSVLCRENKERWNPCREGFAKFCGKLVLQIIVSCWGDITELCRKAALFSNIHCSVPRHKSLSLA